MATIRLFTQPQPTQPETPLIPVSDILNQFIPTIQPSTIDEEIPMANVGTNRVIVDPNQPVIRDTRLKPKFEPIHIQRRRGPLMIHDKRWYFRLVPPQAHEHQRARALMQDYPLNQLVNHLVVCFTPAYLPGSNKPFRKPDGDPGRIFAYFDSYLEFYEYMQKFESVDRAFYEIIFGELPQKPHFDVDIDLENFVAAYAGEDIDQVAELLREAVIQGSIEVLSENMTGIDLQKDVLLYSSHGIKKRSYHIVLNNKCHDGNKEAKAFYDAVTSKVRTITGGKYVEFIDPSVYSPRQQFRLVGCQKQGSNRPKVFYEEFWFRGQKYTHIYNEDVTDPIRKKLTIIYESMVSFTSGCVYLPSLIPPRAITHHNLGELPDLDPTTIDSCLNMLREKMSPCPFTIKEVRGHLIVLKRHAPSLCPICQKAVPHEKENPFMFIISGKVYWDCRRCSPDAKKFFVGYLAMSIEDMQTGVVAPVITNDDVSDEEGQFMFGDYDIGAPTLAPIVRKKQTPDQSPTADTSTTILDRSVGTRTLTNEPQEMEGPKVELPTIYIPPPEYRRQNVVSDVMKASRAWAQRTRIPRRDKVYTGSFGTVVNDIQWDAGISRK
jgi:hypothetical protein